MAVSDGQVALGLLQLVALTFPVFAILMQVYFSMSRDRLNLPVGLVLMIGGGLLILGAILSMQHLTQVISSQLVSYSLLSISGSLIFLGSLVYFIYDVSKDDLRSMKKKNKNYIKQSEENIEKSKEHLEVVNPLIDVMEEQNVESMTEVQGVTSEVPEGVEDDIKLSELKEIRDDSIEVIRESNHIVEESREIITSIENAEKPLSAISLKLHPPLNPIRLIFNKKFGLFVLYAFFIALFIRFLPVSSDTPLGLFIFILLGWILATFVERYVD